MKTIMTRVSIVVSFVTVLLLVVGLHMQRQKANIDSLPAERFDYIMKLYYTGNTLITVAVCLAAIAVVCWIVTAIIASEDDSSPRFGGAFVISAG